jgi:hypothetical protein
LDGSGEITNSPATGRNNAFTGTFTTNQNFSGTKEMMLANSNEYNGQCMHGLILFHSWNEFGFLGGEIYRFI